MATTEVDLIDAYLASVATIRTEMERRLADKAWRRHHGRAFKKVRQVIDEARQIEGQVSAIEAEYRGG